MSRLVLSGPLRERLTPQLLADDRETCAFLFTHRSGDDRVLVTEGELAPDGAYSLRTAIAAQLSPGYLVEVTGRARRSGRGLVFTHTHPRDGGRPHFSGVDDDGERALRRFMDIRQPDVAQFALVAGPEGMRARELGAGPEVRIETVGLRRLMDGNGVAGAVSGTYDRQVRAFGAAGQAVLRGLTVAVVGAGGTGSVVAQQLAHLGVGALVLIDPDHIETTNLNRVVGASSADVGRDKVQVSADAIRRISPEVAISAHRADVTARGVSEVVINTDFLFICTDSHASRAVVNQIAYQHLIPAVDLGVGIVAESGTVRSITGRVQALAPGLPCLLCTQALDSNAIRRELMSEEQRAADPYFTSGGGEPQPAVISLNSTVASLAVTMFLDIVTGIGSRSRYQFYDGVRGVVRSLGATTVADCLICSASGALGRGNSAPLLARGVD